MGTVGRPDHPRTPLHHEYRLAPLSSLEPVSTADKLPISDLEAPKVGVPLPNSRRDEIRFRLFVSLFMTMLLLFGFVAFTNIAWTPILHPVPVPDEVYKADPLKLIAGYNLTTQYTLDEDIWDVWICNVQEAIPDLSPEEAVNLLEAELNPYFAWLSGGRYRPVFRAGGVIESPAIDGRRNCAHPVWEAYRGNTRQDRPEGAIVIINKAPFPSFASLGTISYLSSDEVALRATTFPDNTRSVYLDARSVAEPGSLEQHLVANITLPNLYTVAHELGHGIGFPHSHRYVRYDNSMDLMGTIEAPSGLQIGTIAINRYAAGWMDPTEVAIYRGAESSIYTLSPLGNHGTQMLVLPTDRGSMITLGARVRKAFDSGVPKEGVESYFIEQQPPICFHHPGYPACVGLARRTRAITADLAGLIHVNDPVAHVAGIGEGFTWGDVTVTVLERIGDDFIVEVNDIGSADYNSSGQ